jgi:hypothetical protein
LEARGRKSEIGVGVAIFLKFLEKSCAIHVEKRFSTEPGAPRLVEDVIMIRKIEEASAEYLKEDGTINNSKNGEVAGRE